MMIRSVLLLGTAAALLALVAPAMSTPHLMEFDLLTQAPAEENADDDRPLLQCKTMATTGPKHWGHAIVYCPDGWAITGGGMQSNFAAFERAHPYFNGFMCDNNHGWGSGICFARCCKVPGFQYVSPEAEAAGIKTGKESAQDNVQGSGLREPVLKQHLNTPLLKFFTRASAQTSKPETSLLEQWTKAVALKGYCEKVVSEFTEVSNHAICGGPRKAVMYRFVAKFFPLTRGSWNFHLGSNFAAGGAIYLDGELVTDARGSSQKWDGTWNESPSILSTGHRDLEPKKWHTLDIFGLSGPNTADEPMDIQFQFTKAQGTSGVGAFKPLSLRNLEAACD